MAAILSSAGASHIGKADLALGIPFLFDPGKKEQMLAAVETGLSTFFPHLKTVIICFTDEQAFCPENKAAEKEVAGQETLEAPTEILAQFQGNVITFSYNNKELLKKGWAIRGIMELASFFDADLVILEPSLFVSGAERGAAGLTPDWLHLLYQPVLDGHADFVLPRFQTAHLDNSIADHFVFPLLGALYNLELRASLGAGLTLDRNLLPGYVNDAGKWPEEAFDFGIDTWLLVHALEQGAEVAEVYLGQRPAVVAPVELQYIFVQTVQVLFKAIGKKPSQQSWRKKPAALRSPLIFGARESSFVQPHLPNYRNFIANFRRGLTRFHRALWSRIFPEELTVQLKELAELPEAEFNFPSNLWAQMVYDSLLAYKFMPDLRKEDIASSLQPLFEARLAGFLNEISVEGALNLPPSFSGKDLCSIVARERIDEQMDTFIARKQYFIERWFHRREALQPFLPEIAYWEYIPGVPIILPLNVVSHEGKSEHVSAVYEQLLNEYRVHFGDFVENILGLATGGSPGLTAGESTFKIAHTLRKLLQQLEESLDTLVLPGDIHTPEGMQNFVEQLCGLLPAAQSFSLKNEVAEMFLRKYPPRNLITMRGCKDIDGLFQELDPLAVLALTNWSEEIKYAPLINELFRETLQPHHFEVSDIRPLVVDHRDFPALANIKEAPALNHLASRVVVSNLRHGSGGEFPKIRLFTTILKSIIDAEQFGLIWETFARNRRKFGAMVMNSIEYHRGAGAFSAHSIFENRQHRLLRDRLKEFAARCRDSGKKDMAAAGALLERVVEGYCLGLTLPDGHFITASLWSWASYSFKGGKDFPTPLSLMVERRWFESELFFRCYERIGGHREDIFLKITELMGQGREGEDLAVMYLGAPEQGRKVILKQKIAKEQPPAGLLKRSTFNPLLVPIEGNAWESKYVLNCGALRINELVYILYRAVGDDGISRLGLATSRDGLLVEERLPDPVFVPGHESENRGCEDPRLIMIEGRVYMLYTAYDGVTPQIALASIAPDDLVNFRWQHWHRHGLVFPNFPNKDAVFFPERFGGKLAMYHRINPNIWVTFSNSFDTPWPREDHFIVMGINSGMMWDAVKIGAGAQPLKTKYGWLLIYHGVDYCLCYRLGVFLTALHDPTEILYRSPNPVLEPETSYEIGVFGQCWVPNVVFTCGALPAAGKEILDDDDEILVYYGGADTVIGVASTTLGELLPAKIREDLEKRQQENLRLKKRNL